MVDSYFEIGGSHLVCQDYALHGTFEGMEYGIVADGCSSAEHSEIGAQILCHVARNYLKLYHHGGLFKECKLGTITSMLGNSIVERADELRKLYPITREALQATLLIIVRIENEAFLFVWGDGVIIERYKPFEGSDTPKEFIIKIDYPANAPFYLATDIERYKEFLLKEKGEDKPYKIIETHINGVKHNDNTQTFYLPYAFKYDKYDRQCQLASVTITTDGILTYRDENKNPIDFTEIVPEVSKFKSKIGEFVKKRMTFFKRSVLKKQWTHYDDIAAATILMDQK